MIYNKPIAVNSAPPVGANVDNPAPVVATEWEGFSESADGLEPGEPMYAWDQDLSGVSDDAAEIYSS